MNTVYKSLGYLLLLLLRVTTKTSYGKNLRAFTFEQQQQQEQRIIASNQRFSFQQESSTQRATNNASPCSALPSSTPKWVSSVGGKLLLFATCQTFFPDPQPLGFNRFLSYGACDVYKEIGRSTKIGVFRYSLEAAFGGDSLMQIQYMMRLFDDYRYQIMVTGTYISPETTGPYMDPVATLSIATVTIDQNFTNAKLSDCGFSNYNKLIYTYKENGDESMVNLTFF